MKSKTLSSVKLFVLVTMLYLVLACLLHSEVVKAAEIEELCVSVGDTIEEAGENAQPNSFNINLADDGTMDTYVYSFKVTKDSIVNLGLTIDYMANDIDTRCEAECNLYSDKSMTKSLWTKSSSIEGLQDWVTVQRLKAGTYYVKVKVSAYTTYSDEIYGSGDRELIVNVTAIPTNKAVTFDYAVEDDEVTCTAINNVEIWLPNMWQMASNNLSGYIRPENSCISGDEISYSFKDIQKSKSLIILCLAESEYAGCPDGYEARLSFKVDITAPKISGVKNKTTYRRAVKVTCSDKQTGIKTVTVNGKSMDKKFTLTKAGKYTVEATDNVGNTSTVTFTIKKSKK